MTRYQAIDPYYRSIIRRHYEYLEREHQQYGEAELARTRAEKARALELADLALILDNADATDSQR